MARVPTFPAVPRSRLSGACRSSRPESRDVSHPCQKARPGAGGLDGAHRLHWVDSSRASTAADPYQESFTSPLATPRIIDRAGRAQQAASWSASRQPRPGRSCTLSWVGPQGARRRLHVVRGAGTPPRYGPETVSSHVRSVADRPGPPGPAGQGPRSGSSSATSDVGVAGQVVAGNAPQVVAQVLERDQLEAVQVGDGNAAQRLGRIGEHRMTPSLRHQPGTLRDKPARARRSRHLQARDLVRRDRQAIHVPRLEAAGERRANVVADLAVDAVLTCRAPLKPGSNRLPASCPPQ